MIHVKITVTSDTTVTTVTTDAIDAIDANVTIITRKYDLSAPPQSNVCSNSKPV